MSPAGAARPSKQTLALGLVGCGRAAERLHLPAIARTPRVRLVAVADPRSERRALVARDYPECAHFASHEELLRTAPIDALLVTSPTPTHAAIAAQALAQGVAVLVEKPLASRREEAHPVEALTPDQQRRLMIGFNRRHWRPARRLRDWIRRRGPRDVSAQLVLSTDLGAWSAIGAVGDPLDDLGSHQLDMLRFLFDREILAVRAHWQGKQAIRVEAVLEGGVKARCLAAHTGRFEERVEVRRGESGVVIRGDSKYLQPLQANAPSRLGRAGLAQRLGEALRPSGDPHELQLRAFCAALRAGHAASPGLDDALAALRAVEAARESAQAAGAEVALR